MCFFIYNEGGNFDWLSTYTYMWFGDYRVAWSSQTTKYQQYSYKNSVTLPISCFFGLSASPAVVNPSLKTPKEQEQSVSVPRSPSNMKNLEYFESKVHIKNQYVTSNRFLKFSQIHWSITCKFAWKQMLRVRYKFLHHMFQNKTTPSVNCPQCRLMCQIFQGIFKA